MSRTLILLVASGCRIGFTELPVDDERPDGPSIDATIVTRTFGERPGAMTGVTLDTTLTQTMPLVNSGADELTSISGGMTSLERMLIRFDVSSIPPGTSVAGARLELTIETLNDEVAGELAIYACGQPWNENVATWTTRDTALGWITPGGSMGSVALSSKMPSGTTVTFPLPADEVQHWVNDINLNNGILLEPLVEDSSTHYHTHSSDSLTVTARPLLSVDLAM